MISELEMYLKCFVLCSIYSCICSVSLSLSGSNENRCSGLSVLIPLVRRTILIISHASHGKESKWRAVESIIRIIQFIVRNAICYYKQFDNMHKPSSYNHRMDQCIHVWIHPKIKNELSFNYIYYVLLFLQRVQNESPE